jgi:hypothetical protein
MSIFNQMIQSGGGSYPGGSTEQSGKSLGVYKPRTFKETIQDQITAHKSKVAELEGVRDSMSPEIEKFVEALQKLG